VVQPWQVSPYNQYILLTFFLGALPASVSLQNLSLQPSAHIQDANMSPAIAQRRPHASLESSLALFINRVLEGSLQNDDKAESSGHDHDMAGRIAGEEDMDDRRDKETEQSEETHDAPMFGEPDEEHRVSGNEAGLLKEMDDVAAETNDEADEQSQDAPMFSGSEEEDGVSGDEAGLSKEMDVAAAETNDEGGEQSDEDAKQAGEESEDSDEESDEEAREMDVEPMSRKAPIKRKQPSQQSGKESESLDEESDEESGEMDVEPMSQKAPPVRKRKQPSQQSGEESESSDEESDEEAREMDVSQKAPPVKKCKQPSQQHPRKRRRVLKKVVEEEAEEEEVDDLLEDKSPEDNPIFHLKVGTRQNPIDANLFVSKWEPVTATDIVSLFHTFFSLSLFFFVAE
jgi:hypothetical protein